MDNVGELLKPQIVDVFAIAKELVGTRLVYQCQGELETKLKDKFQNLPIRINSISSATFVSSGNDAVEREKLSQLHAFAIAETVNYMLSVHESQMIRQTGLVADVHKTIAKQTVAPAAATDMAYVAKKKIIVARPGRPEETIDIARIAMGFQIPRNLDITKKWCRLARYIANKCIPRSYLRMMTAVEIRRGYFSIPETFISAVIETILLTCRCRGDQVNTYRLMISQSVRTSLINLCKDVKKTPSASKDVMFKEALLEGFIPPGDDLNKVYGVFQIDPTQIVVPPVVYPAEMMDETVEPGDESVFETNDLETVVAEPPVLPTPFAIGKIKKERKGDSLSRNFLGHSGPESNQKKKLENKPIIVKQLEESQHATPSTVNSTAIENQEYDYEEQSQEL